MILKTTKLIEGADHRHGYGYEFRRVHGYGSEYQAGISIDIKINRDIGTNKKIITLHITLHITL